jgi:hypothetical protein
MFRFGWFIIPAVVVSLLIGGAIGAAIVDHDDGRRGDRVVQITAPSSDTGQQGTPQVITIDEGHRGWHGGFFPFGFIFPLLWIGLIIFYVGFVFRRGRWGGPGGWGGGPGGWNGRAEEWHRRQHEGESSPPQQPGPAASA